MTASVMPKNIMTTSKQKEKINMTKKICIYHGTCQDGFGAAWAVRQYAIDNKELPTWDFYPGVYGETPPDVTGKHVVLVDFSYKPEVLEQMAKTAKSILLLDHHKSAYEAMKNYSQPEGQLYFDMSNSVDFCWDHHMQNIYQDRCEGVWKAIVYAVFDMNKSGAMIAWEFFHRHKTDIAATPPRLIRHIEDRDLWRFELEGTREISAAVFSYPYDFEVWDELMQRSTRELIAEGKVIERKHFKDIKELLHKCQRRMVIGGIDVPVANLPYTMSSDAGHIMGVGEPFAACYMDMTQGRVFSLRSPENGQDVALIAAKYGGGGHKHAAGFTVPIGWEGDI